MPAKAKSSTHVTLTVKVTVRAEDAEDMKDLLMQAVGEGPEAVYSTAEAPARQADVDRFNDDYYSDEVA